MKPKKPYPTFPLTAHERGWVKKYRGHLYWVAPGTTPPEAALRRWHEIVAGLDAGVRVSHAPDVEMTLGRLCNRYYQERERDASAGRISTQHLRDIDHALKRLLVALPPGLAVATLTPDHFAAVARHVASKGIAASTVRRVGSIISGMFKFAADEQWLARPVALGSRWRRLMRPPVTTKPRPISREDCLKLLAAIDATTNQLQARQRLRACVLLALNGGYGPAELAQLRCESVDLTKAVIRQPRGKTGVEHVVPLWPETVDALRAIWPEGRQYLFQTRDGRSLAYATASSNHSPIGLQFRRLAATAGVKASFYSLRHTHRSVSGGAGDEAAADVLIGHRLPGMRAVYQGVSHDRIRSVSMFVRAWLFGVSAPGSES